MIYNAASVCLIIYKTVFLTRYDYLQTKIDNTWARFMYITTLPTIQQDLNEYKKYTIIGQDLST